MKVKCPKCSAELELPGEALGSKVKCGSCNEKFWITPSGTPRVIEEYNLPVGAQWDVPQLNDFIGAYSYDITCSGFAQGEVECEECHKPFKATFRTMIDATEEPRFEDAIASGDYFRFKCPHCGKVRIVAFKVFVWNLRKDYFIRTVFEQKELEAFHQKKSITAEALGLPHDALMNVRQRIVFGVQGIMDKMTVFRAGLSDYAIEMNKEIVMHYNKGFDISDVRLEGVEGNDLRYACLLTDGRVAHVATPRRMHEDILGKLQSVGSFREGILRWVHWKMMRQNYDDWFAE